MLGQVGGETRREQILRALQSMMEQSGFFPPVSLDAPEPDDWRTPIPGEASALGDHAAVQDGPVKVTRDGGAVNDWELELEATLAYSVAGADRGARRARRDAGAAMIQALIRADRQLGLGDPQVYAEIAEAIRDDNIPVKASAPVALLLVTVAVQYVAPSAAG